jgi:hypothetical protein
MALQRDLYRKQFARASDVIVHDVYGVSWDKGASPTLTRTDKAIGLVANAGVGDQVVQNDFDNIPVYKAIHEVIDDYGNVFVRIPKLYIRKTDTENLKTWQVCGTKRPGFYLPWCFWDFVNDRELPYIDVGKYKASLSPDNKLESKPHTFPLRNRNIVQFRDYAKANGPGYQQLDIHVVDVLRTLFFVEFATLNSQAIMQGYTTGQYSDSHQAVVAESNTKRIIIADAQANLYRVGQYISIGTSLGGNQIAVDREITAIDVYNDDNKAIHFDGNPVDIAVGNIVYNTVWKNGFSSGIAASSGCIVANDGKYPCMYRGIESPFSDMWQFVDGVNINNNQAWVCKDASQYISNVFASPYEQVGYVNHNANGYIQTMGYDHQLPILELPTSITGATTPTQYYCDYYYQDTGQRIARFGGIWYSGSNAGISYWNLNYSSGASNLSIGGRLLKKPL